MENSIPSKHKSIKNEKINQDEQSMKTHILSDQNTNFFCKVINGNEQCKAKSRRSYFTKITGMGIIWSVA